MKSVKISLVPLASIEPPSLQLRDSLDPQRLQDLADSMRRVGLLQPIRVRRNADRYQIVAGHRRYLAAQQLGWTAIPALIVDVDDTRAIAESLHENLWREPLTPLEEAALCDHLHSDLQWDVDRIAAALHHSPQWVRDRLSLLELPPDCAEALHAGVVSIAVARTLAQITDPDHRASALDAARSYGMTLRHANEWVRQWREYRDRATTDATANPPIWEDVQLAAQRTLCDWCNQSVSVHDARLYRICGTCLLDLVRRCPPPAPNWIPETPLR